MVQAPEGQTKGVKKASEYRKHAEECRHLAASMEGEQRAQLLEMAETWDRLADERNELLLRKPAPKAPGD